MGVVALLTESRRCSRGRREVDSWFRLFTEQVTGGSGALDVLAPNTRFWRRGLGELRSDGGGASADRAGAWRAPVGKRGGGLAEAAPAGGTTVGVEAAWRGCGDGELARWRGVAARRRGWHVCGCVVGVAARLSYLWAGASMLSAEIWHSAKTGFAECRDLALGKL